MKRVKLIPIYSDPTSAQSFYRAGLPLAELAHHHPLDITNTRGINWFTAVHNDIFFYQMPTSKEALKGAQIVHKSGKKVWVDFDDNAFALQSDNPVRDYWMENNVNEVITGMAVVADVITVSSLALAKVYDKFRDVAGKEPCVVIPNALWDHLITKRSPLKEGEPPLLLWRGGTTHTNNLKQFSEPIINCLNANRDFKIHFLGAHSSWITERLDESQWSEQNPMDLVDYFHYLDHLQPTITTILLSDNEFNRGRSHNGWLEATYAHSRTLAPDFEEWQRPGVTNYRSPEDFEEKLLTMMKHPELKVSVSESWKEITEKYLLSQVNELRWQIIRRLAPHKC